MSRLLHGMKALRYQARLDPYIRLHKFAYCATHSLFCHQYRSFASRKSSPAFTASHQPNLKESPPNTRHKPKAGPDSNSQTEEKPAQLKTGFRRYGITPGRVIALSILTFGLYQLNNWQTDPQRSLILNGKFFTPFLLESKDYVSSTSSILSLLSVPAGQNTANIAEAWKLGVWSVQVMQPELQIARSYTPLPPHEDSPPEQIRLFVRKEPQGEVSGFLHRVTLGTVLHLRGPHPEYVIPDDVNEILFLAGGTGIAPALQVIHCLFTIRELPPERRPKIRVLWANRRREDSFSGQDTSTPETLRNSILAKVRASLELGGPNKAADSLPSLTEEDSVGDLSKQALIVQELEAVRKKHGDHVAVEYFIDEDNRYITESVLKTYLYSSQHDAQEQSSTGQKIVMVSGPEGFISTFAGPKGMKGGRETQGPLGGLLGALQPEGWSVWKL